MYDLEDGLRLEEVGQSSPGVEVRVDSRPEERDVARHVGHLNEASPLVGEGHALHVEAHRGPGRDQAADDGDRLVTLRHYSRPGENVLAGLGVQNITGANISKLLGEIIRTLALFCSLGHHCH